MPNFNQASQANTSLSPSHAVVRRRFAPSALVLALAGALAVPGTASAAGWLGFVSNDWFTAGNWSPVAVPTAANSVVIDAPKTAIVNAGAASSFDLQIGVGSAGTLAIVNGASLTSGYANLANGASSSGTVLVDGAGSILRLNGLGTLRVGGDGKGTVVINHGGTVSNSMLGQIGVDTGSTGAVTVTGPGATWNSGSLLVGNSGTGTLDVTAGGAVNIASTAEIGGAPNGVGRITVNGSGSTLTGAGDLTVGSKGNGTLAVRNGGTVNIAGKGVVGAHPGSMGTVLISGVGSTWTNTSDLYVGYSGSGSMAVTGGGLVSNAIGYIGNQAGSTGMVTVEGAGSTWSNIGRINVGVGGSGTLAIQNGGKVGSAGGYISGSNAGGAGSVTVDGPGSFWASNGEIFMGYANTASLLLSNGGKVASMSGYLGSGPSGKAMVTIDGTGSAWNINGTLLAGYSGVGTMSILNNATAKGGSAYLGYMTGANGTLNIDGTGSSWAGTGDLAVGYAGTGAMAISNGGVAGNHNGQVAAFTGSTGAVKVDGAGSSWVNTGDLDVGDAGTGALTVSKGGMVTNLTGFVGSAGGAIGTVKIDGTGSSWTNAGNLHVGYGGTGSLAISNGGKVSNVTGYVAATLVNATGTVNVDGPGSSWSNTGNLFVGNAGTGTLTIANSGMVSAGGNVTIASQASSTGTLNIGGAVGAAPVAPGSLNAPAIIFGAGTGTLNFNHSDLSETYNFSTTLVGAGTLNHNAGWTNLMEDSSLFTGPTHVNGGRLVVYGGMDQSLFDVNSGGTLGGNGYVGGTVVNAGGTIAPGTTSVGTLHVVGNIKFSAGSSYQLDVNAAGLSDKIMAETATLRGGDVRVTASVKGGTYGPSTSYNILSTTGGVTGTFANVTSNLAFLDPTLSYDPNNVYLMLTRNKKAFASVGTNALQRSTAASVESLARVESSSPVYQAVVVLSAPQARAAFDQLSGEVHASARGVQLENSHLTRDVSLERLRIAGNEDTGNDGGGASEEGSTSPRLLRSLREPSFWTRAMGSWGTMDGNGAATVKRDSAGFMMGVDTRVGEEGRFGLMGGYGSSSFDVSTRNASGSSDNYTFGAYGGTRWGDLALRGGVAYTWQDVATRRTVAFTGFTDSLSADYKASTTQLFAELGWRIKREQSEFEPFVNLSHVNVASDGFTERGGAASLTSASSSSGVTFSTLGVRASTQLSSGGTDVTARGSLGWRHAFGDTSPTTAAAFTGSSAFEMTGAPVAKSVGVIEAGLDFKLSNTATLGITYGGQFGSGLKEHSARVQLHVAF